MQFKSDLEQLWASLSMMTCSRSEGASNEACGQIVRRHELTFLPYFRSIQGSDVSARQA